MAGDIFDYIETRADGDDLIREFCDGKVSTIRRTSNSGTDYDPTQSVTDFPTFAVKIEFSLKQMQSGSILENDERWLVAAGPLQGLGLILPSDVLLAFNVDEKTIIKADLISPANVVCLFDCQVRV
jgi:hypothetical protein